MHSLIGNPVLPRDSLRQRRDRLIELRFLSLPSGDTDFARVCYLVMSHSLRPLGCVTDYWSQTFGRHAAAVV